MSVAGLVAVSLPGSLPEHDCPVQPQIPLFIRIYINIYKENIVYGNESNKELKENAGNKNKGHGFV